MNTTTKQETETPIEGVIEHHAPSQQPLAAYLPKPAFDYQPTTFEGAMKLADLLASSDMVPKDYRGRAGNCFVAMQWGAEVGLRPLQALQNIAVINGRPSLWGDAVLALVLNSTVCEYVKESFSEDGSTAICVAKRRGQPEKIGTFSMEDAERAGLLSKDGTWKTYPQRMLKMRARAWALRDAFADVLKGMAIAEEVQDIKERDFEPAAMPPRVAMPQARSKKNGDPQQPGAGETDADHTPASDNMKKMLVRKLASAALTDTECAKHLGIENLENLTVAHVNQALKWIANPS